MTRRTITALLAVLFLSVFTTGEAIAAASRSGGTSSSSSGSRSGSSSYSGSRSTSSGTRANTPKPSSSSTGRQTKAPTTATKPSTSSKSGTTAGRTTKAPTRTGTKVVASRVKNTVQPRTGKINISRDTVAGGRTYRVPGTGYEYRYSRASYNSYYARFGPMGYPTLGTPLYWQLLNDPFYYPNYLNPASPWFQHRTPVGYTVHDGKLIANKQGFNWGKFFLYSFLVILIVGAAGAFAYSRYKAREDRPYDL